jgi:hypothetical protein
MTEVSGIQIDNTGGLEVERLASSPPDETREGSVTAGSLSGDLGNKGSKNATFLWHQCDAKLSIIFGRG